MPETAPLRPDILNRLHGLRPARMADVFLDLWGVLTDSRTMEAAYRQRLAEILSARHGGTVEAWLRAHDVSYAWYSAHMDAPETWEGGTWLEVVDRAGGESIERMFREAGLPPPSGPRAFANAIEFEAMKDIDAAFPDARPAVRRLKASGDRVFLSTAATEANARGALTGARLLELFDGLVTGETQNALKSDPAYWRSIPARLGVEPRASIVVDDRGRYLEAAASVGFRCLLLDREERGPPEGMPPFVEATLRNLVGLPPYVDHATGRVSDPRKVF
jgi:HAD superfamily hydrolase (TIGR01509 family)